MKKFIVYSLLAMFLVAGLASCSKKTGCPMNSPQKMNKKKKTRSGNFGR